MQPITGPYTKIYEDPWEYSVSTSMRQKRPYDLPLPRELSKGYVFGPANAGQAWRYRAWASSAAGSERLYAKAYEKLVSELGENAGLGVTLAQWKEADSMIRNRANQLTRFTSALVRRSPLGIAASLGISAKQVRAVLGKRYGVARSLSNLWLEFWFGWKPAVSDIYTACEVFDNFIPWAHIRGASSEAILGIQAHSAPYMEQIRYEGKSSLRINTDVRLVNPNVRLMQQFGILNPATVAFDAFPWSFVYGWFSNVSSWLGSFTDFAGMETSGGYISRKCVIDGKTWYDIPPIEGTYQIGSGRGVYVKRESISTVPRPSLYHKVPSIAPTRALTAISLLVQKLPR